MDKLFIVDITGYKEYENPEMELKAEDIVLYRDLIRGYTLNPIIAISYHRFLESSIGVYVEIGLFEYEVPKNLSANEYKDMALEFSKELASENHVLYASTCPEIKCHKVSNSESIYCTEAMLMSINRAELNRNIICSILYLFDKSIRYVLPMIKDESLINFRQLLLDGITDRLKLGFNPVATINYYIMTLQFLR